MPLEKLTLSADANNVKVTALVLSLLGTMQPPDFASGGIKVYADENANGTVDAEDFILGTATPTSATVSAPINLTVNSGTARTLLVAARFAQSAVVGRTVGVKLDANSAVNVDAPDVMPPEGFPMESTLGTLVGEEPTIVAALAIDASSTGAGIQTGDQVIVVFSAATNGSALTAENIDSSLVLNNGHTWLSGAGTIESATWTTGDPRQRHPHHHPECDRRSAHPDDRRHHHHRHQYHPRGVQPG